MEINIVVPAYNEEKIIKENVLKIYNFCQNNLNIGFVIVVADNASKDSTAEIVKNLASENEKIKYLYVPQKGKGNAIFSAWKDSPADILCFMDADLATDLSALPKLISEMIAGNDLVLGCRYLKDSKVNRELRRKIISRIYRLAVKIILGSKVKDLPCGFKAISLRVRDGLLDKTVNREWFFDSELVIIGERSGYKIREVPVTWTESRTEINQSRVSVIKVGSEYIKELLRLRKRLKTIIND